MLRRFADAQTYKTLIRKDSCFRLLGRPSEVLCIYHQESTQSISHAAHILLSFRHFRHPSVPQGKEVVLLHQPRSQLHSQTKSVFVSPLKTQPCCVSQVGVGMCHKMNESTTQRLVSTEIPAGTLFCVTVKGKCHVVYRTHSRITRTVFFSELRSP